MKPSISVTMTAETLVEIQEAFGELFAVDPPPAGVDAYCCSLDMLKVIAVRRFAEAGFLLTITAQEHLDGSRATLSEPERVAAAGEDDPAAAGRQSRRRNPRGIGA
jgi:hypothetical protein